MERQDQTFPIDGSSFLSRLSAGEDLVTIGRSFGLGKLLITRRANNAFRTVGVETGLQFLTKAIAADLRERVLETYGKDPRHKHGFRKNISPSESLVVQGSLEGLRLVDIAKASRKKLGTVRSQYRSVLEKAETYFRLEEKPSQIELVGLVLRELDPRYLEKIEANVAPLLKTIIEPTGRKLKPRPEPETPPKALKSDEPEAQSTRPADILTPQDIWRREVGTFVASQIALRRETLSEFRLRARNLPSQLKADPALKDFGTWRKIVVGDPSLPLVHFRSAVAELCRVYTPRTLPNTSASRSAQRAEQLLRQTFFDQPNL